MPTEDSKELANKALCSPEQLAIAIESECKRREAAGFADAVQAVQPQHAPKLDDDLVGAQIEVCWHYTSAIEDGKTKVREPCFVIFLLHLSRLLHRIIDTHLVSRKGGSSCRR